MNSTLTYLKSFFKDKDVASVTPTSRFCIQTVCKPIDFSQDLHILEYGAGAGVFAASMLPRMTPGSTFTMFETNDILFEKLKEIDDSRVRLFNKSVEYVLELLGEEKTGSIDYILSGIPFSFIDDDTTLSILKQSKNLLKRGGAFLAYQTSGHLKNPLQQTFGEIETEWEWRNIPPMTVYRAVKKEKNQQG